MRKNLIIFGILIAAAVLLAWASREKAWLMTEEEILTYYRETYGQEMELVSRSLEEHQEGDTHTRSQECVLRPKDLPELEFRFSEWAGYAYSPGPIPQLRPSFSRSMTDSYPSDALAWALEGFVTEHGLGLWEEREDRRVLTLEEPGWEAGVEQLAGYVNGLRDQLPYSRVDVIWLLCFRRVLPDGQEAIYQADLVDQKRLALDPEAVIAGVLAAEARDRAVQRFDREFRDFLAATDLEWRAESSYRDWTFCHEFTASIQVGSLEEVDRVLETLEAFAAPRRNQELYANEALRGIRVTVHFVWRGVPEPKGQVGTWAPFAYGGLSLDAPAIRERIRKLYLLPLTDAEARGETPIEETPDLEAPGEGPPDPEATGEKPPEPETYAEKAPDPKNSGEPGVPL